MREAMTVDRILANADAVIAARREAEKTAAAKAPVAKNEVEAMADKLASAAIAPAPRQTMQEKVAEALIITQTLAALEDLAPVGEFVKAAAASGHDEVEALRFCLQKQAAALQTAGKKLPTALKVLGAGLGLAGAGYAGSEIGAANEQEKNDKVLRRIGGQVGQLRESYQDDVMRAFEAGLEQGQATA